MNKKEFGPDEILRALQAIGELLEADAVHLAIIIVGGATLNLLGIIKRTTSDIDVIALATQKADGSFALENAKPLPPKLSQAIQTVARDLGLPGNWLNAEVGSQWAYGFPPGIADDITWKTFGALDVGLVGRRTLIALKLFAMVDRGPASKHFQDLIALKPTKIEIDEAATWVSQQDASSDFANELKGALDHVSGHLK